MPDLRYIARRAVELGALETARRGFAAVRRRHDAVRVRNADRTRSTYALDEQPAGLTRLFPAAPTDPAPAWLEDVARRFLGHRFNLLGSGWVPVGYGAEAPGLEGHRYGPDRRPSDGIALAQRQSRANAGESLRLRGLIDGGYVPIDWHRDFKSGFRWNEATWYRDISYGDRLGVDVKVPWELARSQHLPLLAWCALTTRDDALARGCVSECRNEIVDFIAANPPRYGVNWACTMEVAIRAVNWLLAWDLLREAPGRADTAFEDLFGRSILEHGRHIFGNLEWSPTLRGNHYLADVVGLLFVAAALPDTDETREWFSFARAEVLAEAELQFWPDGGNFEASTAYHRLSSELLVYALALIVGREGADAVPADVWERVRRAGEFVVDITRPDGNIVQFGDNDSGRLFKIGSVFRAAEDGPDEDHLDVRHLVAAISGLVPRPEFERFAAAVSAEVPLVRGLAGGRECPIAANAFDPAWPAADVRIGDEDTFARAAEAAREVREYVFAGGDATSADLRAYPDFGFYLVRTDRIWLAVRCGPIGQNGNGGHAHNDQLAVELFVDGEPVWVDPGTYLYTPLPARRDEYRSVHAHHAPRVAGREPATLDKALFRLGDEAKSCCVYFGERGFLGYHDGYGPRVWRSVELRDNGVRVVDWVEGGSLRLLDDGETPPYSRGYGLRSEVTS